MSWGTGYTWFHGGVPGLEPGDLILPPTVTGASGSAWDAPGFVWVTTGPGEAREYASHCGGDLYQVRPHELQTDLDNPEPLTTLSAVPRHLRQAALDYCPVWVCVCRSAVVVRVAERGCPPLPTFTVSVNGGPPVTRSYRKHRDTWTPAPEAVRNLPAGEITA